MLKFEKFLSSNYYICLVFIIAFLTWSFQGNNVDAITFGTLNLIGTFIIALFVTALLILQKNTIYVIPPLISLLFVVNNSQISFDTLNQFGLPFIFLFVVLSGPIIYMIRFKPKFKIKALTLGLFLIALAYVIPLLFTSWSLKGFMISIVGFLYFGFYLFFSNTVKGNMDYLMKIMMIINILIFAQFNYKVLDAFHTYPELSIVEQFTQGIQSGWYSNFGWANINDITFYVVLTMPSFVYFIFKHPKKIFFWFLLFIPVYVILFSGSRGALIGFLIATIGLGIIILIKGKAYHYIHLAILLVLGIVVVIFTKDIIINALRVTLDTFSGGTISSISSGRIYIYYQGLNVFKENPIFGASWLAVDQIGFAGRIFMFHSTIIQVLATMGLFGLLALLVHYFQIFKMFYTNFTFEKQLILIGYIATQMHGLIDNVQFSVPYSFIIVILFPIIENAVKPTIFKKENGKYVYHDITLPI